MRRTLIIPLVLLFGAPAAQGDEAPLVFPDRPTIEEMMRGAREALEALRGTVSPWMEGLGAVLENPEDYLPPETLPNGDIVIRRRTAPLPAPRPAPPAGNDTESIAL